MDFFQSQDQARRKTHILVGLFLAALVAIIAVVYAAAHIGLGLQGSFEPLLLLQVAGAVLVVVAIGSAMRIAGLRRGGPAVAEMLGARRISPDTTNNDERRLVNVIEEMALASGTPVPAIYVLDREEGINAFAAGYTLHDAAVAVTRGALSRLTRDELQGVIAHEFSHILNGDMRLNVRLIGTLYGILMLAVVGRMILYTGPRGGGSRSRNSGGGGAGAWFIMVGLALLLVGYIGVFFGKLIKAAVSRQREYLADAAAVQFTRNPAGLSGALKKIGGSAGSTITEPHAEELSHLFFADGLSGFSSNFLSTHPPLTERIRRLEPGWDGTYPSPERPLPPPERRSNAAAAGVSSAVSPLMAAGAPTAEHLAFAAALLEQFPRPLLEAAHDSTEARTLILALVMVGTSVQNEHRAALRAYGGLELEARVFRLAPVVRQQGIDARLPLLDLALPALQGLSPDEVAEFRAVVVRLAKADGRLAMFEYALLHTLDRRLRDDAGRKTRGDRSLGALASSVEALLSAVAYSGSRGEENAGEAFERARQRLGNLTLTLQPANALPVERLDEALSALEEARPSAKKEFLLACTDIAMADGILRPQEAELLRAISESIGVPLPPVLPAVMA
jgi:Zn-dependent protease with chaperone function